MEELKLRSIDGDHELALTGPQHVIGRGEGSDLLVASDLLSRRHARVTVSNGQWHIEDLNSTNGTFVNNRQIIKPTVIRPGDVIKLGAEAFHLVDPSEGEKTVVASRLPDAGRTGGGSVVINDTEDRELTSYQQSYQMPAGWDDEAISSLGDLDDTAKRVLDRMAAANPVPDVALLFFIRDRKPLVFGISKTKAASVWSIGRASDNKITVDDPSISQHHADLHWQDGGWIINDAKSTNGLRYNGENRRSVALSDGTLVTVGGAQMLFRLVKS